MNRLTEHDRITILMMRGWGDRLRSHNDVATLFNDTFRVNGTGISRRTVGKTITRFETTGSVTDLPRSGRPATATNDETSLNVLLSVVENQHTSIRRVSAEHGIGIGSVHRILKRNHFHPYKIHLVQELNEDDPDRRLEFCELMMNRINADPNFLNNIVFSDEATFQLNGEVNRHNCRYWSDHNPDWMYEAHTQYPQKLNVWAGIINNTLIGPFFIEGNLNAEIYERMLRNEIVPAIQAVVGENMNDTFFQQDGAAPHYARDVRAYLDQIFNGRWIGRRGAIEWPARSPDLSPLDYFLWGYLKSKVYATRPANLDELRRRIVEEAALTDQEFIQRAVQSFYNRLGYCQEENGRQFEHKLN